MSLSKPAKVSLPIFSAVILFFGASLLLIPSFRTQEIEGTTQTVIAHLHPAPKNTFPQINEANLSTLQRKIIMLSKQEYAKKPVSFNTTVLAYTQGSKESWCADYISWVLLKAGEPLKNPNSGNWRIPGTGTIQDYFLAHKAYEQAGNYIPQVGDVAIYRHNRSHVNFVIAVSGRSMTTIGGNETGHLRINKQAYSFGTEGLSGFGKLDSIQK